MKAIIKRITKETQVELSLDLYGCGKYEINTSLPFLDHMLSQFALHGNFNLKLKASGDRAVDDHHLVEDIGIALGLAIKKSLGNKRAIKRYGNFLMPMDEALSFVVIDLSGRPYFSFNVKFKKTSRRIGKTEFDYLLLEEFFRAISNNAQINLQIKNLVGKNNHHIAESIFKGFGKALSDAASISRLRMIPSTKGKL